MANWINRTFTIILAFGLMSSCVNSNTYELARVKRESFGAIVDFKIPYLSCHIDSIKKIYPKVRIDEDFYSFIDTFSVEGRNYVKDVNLFFKGEYLYAFSIAVFLDDLSDSTFTKRALKAIPYKLSDNNGYKEYEDTEIILSFKNEMYNGRKIFWYHFEIRSEVAYSEFKYIIPDTIQKAPPKRNGTNCE